MLLLCHPSAGIADMCHYAGWQMCWSNDRLYTVFTEVSLPPLVIVLGHKYLEKSMEWSALACELLINVILDDTTLFLKIIIAT